MPRCCGCRVGSVLASSMNVLPRSALVMNILLPFTTYASPHRTAVVCMAAASEPAFASVSIRPPRRSPVANSGR